jgi:regulator of protease activity HflC (stomatin/prohibitin superfamily)
MGKFNRVLDPGLAILIPFLDTIKYVQVLKELAVPIPTQTAITAGKLPSLIKLINLTLIIDNVTLKLDGVLYYRVIDPYKASYGVEDAHFSISQLAQTTMRAEIGQLTLDLTLAERNTLNHNIVEAINAAAENWGIKCLRYEIRDIHPPEKVVESMHSLVSAERSKRAQILESEGQRQASINVAEGKKQSVILESEAIKAQQINQALGEAEAILAKAKATAEGIEKVAKSTIQNGGLNAVSLSVAQQYVDAFSQLAKAGNSVVVPANVNDVGGMVAQAMAIFKNVNTSFSPENGSKANDIKLESNTNGNNSSGQANNGNKLNPPSINNIPSEF